MQPTTFEQFIHVTSNKGSHWKFLSCTIQLDFKTNTYALIPVDLVVMKLVCMNARLFIELRNVASLLLPASYNPHDVSRQNALSSWQEGWCLKHGPWYTIEKIDCVEHALAVSSSDCNWLHAQCRLQGGSSPYTAAYCFLLLPLMNDAAQSLKHNDQSPVIRS